MGEIADMMLDGTMCEGCGEWLNDGEDGQGWPGLCESCQRIRDKAERATHPTAPRDTRLLTPKTIPCGSGCSKFFRTEEAARDHRRMKHGINP